MIEKNDQTNGEEINSYDQASIDKIKDRTRYRAQYQREIADNEKIQKYFEGYNPHSIKHFVDTYTRNKIFWKEYGPMYGKMKEDAEMQWINQAFQHLGHIQQKKLFDVQCLWRADQIKLSDVTIAWDFNLWENNILACPFIDPITEAEIDMYIQFLRQNSDDANLYDHCGWQNYADIKRSEASHGEHGSFPDWYYFHNNKTGNGILLQLPDLRGERENFYIDLWRSDFIKQNPPKQAENNTPKEERPMLSGYDADTMELFVKTFESKQVQQWYRDYLYGNAIHSDEAETLQGNVDILLAAGEPISINAHSNWMEAIQQAVNSYKIKKISEALWQAWDQYKFTIEAGVGFALNEEDWQTGYGKEMAEHILIGRRLNGEPEDFDF